jgi:peptidoglycan biosynthesis protein MviN/MurJ (putative lipid II flippase)
MKTLKIISKVATFFGVVSIIFTVVSAIITYYLVANSGAPADYIAVYILSDTLPYLFLTALSLVVAAICRGAGKESFEKEKLPQAQPAEEIA